MAPPWRTAGPEGHGKFHMQASSPAGRGSKDAPTLGTPEASPLACPQGPGLWRAFGVGEAGLRRTLLHQQGRNGGDLMFAPHSPGESTGGCGVLPCPVLSRIWGPGSAHALGTWAPGGPCSPACPRGWLRSRCLDGAWAHSWHRVTAAVEPVPGFRPCGGPRQLVWADTPG